MPEHGHVAADGHDGECEEGGHDRQVRRQLEHEAVGALGEQVLLEEQLDAVGEGLQQAPKGPARLGPMRACMSEMTLRSNQIINMTETSRAPNATSTLMTTMSTPTSPRRGA